MYLNYRVIFLLFQKRFKRVRQFEDDEDEADQENEGEDREAIANELFEGGSDNVTSHCSLLKEYNCRPVLIKMFCRKEMNGLKELEKMPTMKKIWMKKGTRTMKMILS